MPHISAPSIFAAWEAQGFAAAQDRMWQMETSRHLARGTLASILGPSALASDEEAARRGYSTGDLQAQFSSVSPFGRQALVGYAAGVNRYLRTSPLPPEFEASGDKPTDWSPLDSVAICVRLFQEFGRGGGGQLRNLAFVQYASSQPSLKNRVVDALDDFAWQNDSAAVTTISSADASGRPVVIYPAFDDAVTRARLAKMPMPNIFELIPAIGLAERRDSHLVAESHSLPYRTGSYCVVVSPRRSSSGCPLLLSGPQMGFTTPSILHEVSLSAPGLNVSGADVPGVPGVMVGRTPEFAWGITSGEAASEDVVWSRLSGTGYLHQGVATPFVVRRTAISVKGAAPVSVTSKWTVFGPVVLESGSSRAAFSLHTGYRGVEMRSFDALLATYSQRSARAIDRSVSPATMSFNYFYATAQGDIGYRYLGRIPLRAGGLDPRLPTPDEAKYAWRGFVPSASMPHVLNPRSGVLANWNNKPVAWWPNGDTPLWGRIHEANSLFDELDSPRFSVSSLGSVVERIAKKDFTWPFFKELGPAFDGRLVDGSLAASSYERWFEELRRRTVEPLAGGFLSPEVFRLVAQPTLVWNALHGRTRLDFLGGRKAAAVASSARSSLSSPYTASAARFGNLGSMMYRNRGTFIQIVEVLRSGPRTRTVLPPGESSSGAHAGDQVGLANRWGFKRE